MKELETTGNDQYSEERITCNCHDAGVRPTIETITYRKNSTPILKTLFSKIVILHKGLVSFTYGNLSPILVKESQLFFIPSGQEVIFKTIQRSQVVLFRIERQDQYSNCHPIEDLYDSEDNNETAESGLPTILDLCAPMEEYLRPLLNNLKDDVKCSIFQNIKLQELFYLLRVYYDKANLKALLMPMLSSDMSFSEAIRHASLTAKGLPDLAEATNMSISGLKKKFKATFGDISPYRWLQEQKAIRIYQKMCLGAKTMEEIQEEEGFASVAALNIFCKRYLSNRCIPKKVKPIRQKTKNTKQQRA